MRSHLLFTALSITVLGALTIAQPKTRLNPMIDLLEQKKPVFGLYAPSAGRGNRGAAPSAAAPATPPVVKTAADLAAEALAYEKGDILFSGAMERNFDSGFGPFAAFAAELAKSPARLKHPLVTKIPKIATDPARAIDQISRQLNLGVSTIVFVDVESADEVQQGLAAMRFKARGGSRPEAVGGAPAYWGVSEAEYRQKADLWPLNPGGELVNWTIVESREGLSRVREIAAVKGIGALFPGAGTLRGLFTTVNQEGQRIFDEAGWEAAIQQVLAACKEFNVACGYPATEKDIEMRMKQGFSVFIINWGEAGFRAVEIGRKAAGR
ncbi:MAG TPA: aldolase/citrate lyase family protein [Vicinamibacterales bacterium]|nr:aldolase/citrate lyase family protein [Vicinamibacterales bacterium]